MFERNFEPISETYVVLYSEKIMEEQKWTRTRLIVILKYTPIEL